MRPFPVIGGKMWIMPWAAAATQEIMTLYFQDSRLPYADAALPPAAAAAMRGHRQRRNRELEAEAGDVVQNLALPYRFRWTPEEANAAVLVGFLGEIDLLVADVAASRLLVCEVKDPEAAFAPAAVHPAGEAWPAGRGRAGGRHASRCRITPFDTSSATTLPAPRSVLGGPRAGAPCGRRCLLTSSGPGTSVPARQRPSRCISSGSRPSCQGRLRRCKLVASDRLGRAWTRRPVAWDSALAEGRGIRFGRGEPLFRVLLSCGLVLKEVGQFSDAQPSKPTGG